MFLPTRALQKREGYGTARLFSTADRSVVEVGIMRTGIIVCYRLYERRTGGCRVVWVGRTTLDRHQYGARPPLRIVAPLQAQLHQSPLSEMEVAVMKLDANKAASSLYGSDSG